jgi:PKD repeat protein
MSTTLKVLLIVLFLIIAIPVSSLFWYTAPSTAPTSSTAAQDANPALTAQVWAAINGTALTTPDEVTSITSDTNGRVIVTLWRTTDALTGQTGAAAVTSADAVGTVDGNDLLTLVPQATSIEIRDANNTVLAVCVRK